MSEDFDVIVIGGGPAGEVAAGRVAAGGLQVALVEAERVGGECAFWACIPSKSLLRPVEELDIARHTPGVQQEVRGEIDVAAVIKHRENLTKNYDDTSQVDWLRSHRISLVRGRGRLTGEREVLVTGEAGQERRLRARKAVIVATGSKPRIPEIPGLADVCPWTNREATSAKCAPGRLLILGGGPVGVELAQAWKALGSRVVTIVTRAGLLERHEPFAGEIITQALRDAGVELRLRTQIRRVSRTGKDVTATLDSGDTIVADEILVATGRLPATQDLGLETIGLTPGQPIAVDHALRAKQVAGEWLYAVGDVNGRNLLTHMGKYQGRLAGDHILGKMVSAWADKSATPQAIFTQPQVAAAGLTEDAARKQGLRVRAVRSKLEDVAGTATLGPYWKGVAQFVVDEDRRIIVGATFVGPGVGEMIHAATIAIAGEVPLHRLCQAVPAYPLVSEIWLDLLELCGV